VLTAEAQAARRSPADLVHVLLQRVPVPQGADEPTSEWLRTFRGTR
jgi:MoxR-like ATPase